jgi:hypothetical protein
VPEAPAKPQLSRSGLSLEANFRPYLWLQPERLATKVLATPSVPTRTPSTVPGTGLVNKG